MSRARRVNVRFWNDEDVADLDPLDRLTVLYLMTAPLSSPIGVMVIPPSTLQDAVMPGLDQVTGWIVEGTSGLVGDPMADLDPTDAIRCGQGFGERLAQRSLKRLEDCGMIWRDRSLFVLPNYLEYNAPDNPNVLRSWVHSVEELPRSGLYARLRDHLRGRGNVAEWLYPLLLDPLAEGIHGRLSSLFRSRWLVFKEGRGGKRSRQRTGKRTPKRTAQPTGEGSGEGSIPLTPPPRTPPPIPISGSGSDAGGGPGGEQQQQPDKGTRAPSAARRIKLDPDMCRFTGITGADVARWEEAYPGLDVRGKIRQMEVWLAANPSKRYTNYAKFIVNWLRGDHEKLTTQRPAVPPDQTDKVEAALRGEAPMTQEVLDLLGGAGYFDRSTEK